MDNPVSEIGENLKEIRVNRDFRLYETSKPMGVSKPMIGQIELDQSVQTITILREITNGLKAHHFVIL